MRPLILATLVFFLLSNSFAQTPLSKEDRLYYNCKIWGFMKYYHPLVSKGSYNWDEKLDKLLSTTAKYKTYEEYSEYMTRYIYYMGQIQPCQKCNQQPTHEHASKNFDMSWTQDSRFSPELRSSLKNIEKNRFQGDHHYIGKGKVGQFEPKNEPEGYDITWKLENSRLLPLFRYWNYIEYFFPYKYLTDQDWDDVLKEMIPKFLAAESKLEWHLAMLELVVKVDDSHAGLTTPALLEWPYYSYLPALFNVVEDKVVITEIIDKEKAAQDDLQIGDIITSVNGQSTIDRYESIKRYISGSNEAAKNRNIYYTLFMGLESPVNVTIERNGVERSASINIYNYGDIKFDKPAEEANWKKIGDSIGYVDMGKIVVGEVDQIMDELENTTAIIFDVRNYPKGVYKAIAKRLKPSRTPFATFTRPDFSYPGKFMWQGESSCGEENEDYYKGKVILLVNGQTQSHAEFTCMCLQTAPDVVTIGNQTSGADGNISRFPIFQRLYTTISGIGVYYPDGKETQRVGIQPDIYVEQTAEGIRDGRDEVLEKAIEIAKKEIAREIAEAKAAMQRALDSIRMDSIRMDSLRLDSLQLNALPMDSTVIDSLRVDDRGN